MGMDLTKGADSPITLHVAADDAGERLDRLIAGRLPDLSRSRVKALIDDGQVTVDGVVATGASTKVRPDQVILLTIPAPIDDEPVPQAMDLPIIYEDKHLLVLDKPAGLVVHPAAGNPDHTLVNALLAHCGDSLAGIGGVKRPGIVHRLDKDTSGLMVVAKDEVTHTTLSTAFAERDIERAYHAVVWGTPFPREGLIDAAVGRSTVNRQKMAVTEKGKHAVTGYRTLKPLGLQASLVECRLQTGRTHQIRVHMTHIGHPLIGDPLYGRTRAAKLKMMNEKAAAMARDFPRQALHAVLLGFDHPITGKHLGFKSDYPADIAKLICSLETL